MRTVNIPDEDSALITPNKSLLFGVIAIILLFSCAGLSAAELFTDTVLPVEGKPFRLVVREDGSSSVRVAHVKICDAKGTVLTEREVPLEKAGNVLQGSIEAIIPKNGMFKGIARVGETNIELPIPVVSSKREINLIYYGLDLKGLKRGDARWATLVTSCAEDAVAELRARGVTPLRWHWGSNYLGDLQKQGNAHTPQSARELAKKMYTDDAAKMRKDGKGYDGFGMDEFGGYTGSEFVELTKGYVRGIIDSRATHPEGFTMLAWHAGPIDPELMGLYKRGVEFLIPESYLLQCVPSQLGTELASKDLEGRIMYARANDMFTAPYKSRCRIIPSVDVSDEIPAREYEPFFRMLRREYPEIRGIAFFNVLKKYPENYKIINQLCMDYFIKPVLTFQEGSLWHDRLGSGKVTACLSNIGGMDSGEVRLRLLADGREVAAASLSSAPAGFSRCDNRAVAVFDWNPPEEGTRHLRVEIVKTTDATVLDPAMEADIYFASESR